MQELNVKLLSPYNESMAPELLPAFRSGEFTLDVFDERTINFSDNLSKTILQNKDYNRIPALTALAYWLRKSNIQRIIKENSHLFSSPQVKTLPLGKILHICPSNVDTIFVYSLMISLLSGNKNILRVSSKNQPSFLDFLFGTLNLLCKKDEFNIFGEYINIISYPHNKDTSSFLSLNVDGRIIWGGDATAAVFKEIPTNPRCRDIIFSDRLSFSVIKCSEYLKADTAIQVELAKKFYNDSYTFDQKGCSSPQQVFFQGSKPDFEKTVSVFFNNLDDKAKSNYEYDEASLSVLKFNQVVSDAIEGGIKDIQHQSSYAYSISPGDKRLKHSCGGGYFYSAHIESLTEINELITTKIQTLSYFGLDKQELNDLTAIAKGKGIDRIVPVGKALDFDYIWDGYNLVNALTRALHTL